ncbi:MAG: transporter [Pseudomonadota bacterium]
MTRRFVVPGATALALACGSASAHHPGAAANSGTAGPINTLSATTLEQGRFAVSFTYEMTKVDAFSDAELAAYSGADQHVHSMDRILAPALGLAYGVTNDLMVSLRLPYVKRSDIREAAHHHEEHGHGEHEEEHGSALARGDSAGIGDLTVLGQYRLFNNRASGTEFAALAGFKAPTGRTGVRDDHGEIFEAEFQPGSGAWDGLFGLAATQRLGAVSLDAHVLYILTGEGTQDTDLGDRLHYGVALSYRMLGGARAGGPMYAGAHSHSHSHPKGGPAHHHHEEAPAGPALDLVLELNGEWSDQQEIAGVEDPNSGGHTFYVSPGARLSMGNWSGFASVGIPIVNNLDGIQAEPEWRLLTGISVGF